MPSKSKSQQRFMGMVHAAQKGDLKNPPKAIKDAAKSMKKKDAKDFASTKHKGLPEKVKKEEVEETVQNVVFNESNTRARFVNEMQDWRSDPKEFFTQVMMMLDEEDVDYDQAEEFIINNGHWMHSQMADGNDPEQVAMEIANILNDVPGDDQMTIREDYGKPYVSDTTEPKYDPDDRYRDEEGWTLKQGDMVEFDLRGMEGEWMDEPEIGEIAVAHDQQVAKVLSQATATEVGDRDYEYYDIQFEDGEMLDAVSGYHLFDV